MADKPVGDMSLRASRDAQRPDEPPLVMGGQGRSDESVASLALAFCVFSAAAILVLVAVCL